MRALIWKSFFTNWKEGELNRRQYAICLVLWLIVVVVVPISIIFYISQSQTSTGSQNAGQGLAIIILWIWVLFLTLPFLFNMFVKRIRNTGLPGWKSLVVFYFIVTVLGYLLSIIPYFYIGSLLGPILIILAFLLFLFLPAGCLARFVKPREPEIDQRAE